MNYFCRQASQLASDSLDRSLNWIEKIRLYAHQLMCRACHQNTCDLQLMHRLLQTKPHKKKLTHEQRQKILQSFKSKT